MRVPLGHRHDRTGCDGSRPEDRPRTLPAQFDSPGGGRAKADRVFGLAKKYNAAVIVLTIDEQGMAKTAERKLEVAGESTIAVNEHGLRPQDLVFDALTFTLATGTKNLPIRPSRP